MSDENKAVKTRTAGHVDTSSPHSGKIAISTSSEDKIRVDLRGAVTEVEYHLPPDMQLTYEASRVALDSMDDELEAIQKKYGMEVYKAARHAIGFPLMYVARGVKGDEVEALEKKFKDDLVELIDHFEDVVKAHLVSYAADRAHAVQREMEHAKIKARQQLKDVLEHGESAIPKDEE